MEPTSRQPEQKKSKGLDRTHHHRFLDPTRTTRRSDIFVLPFVRVFVKRIFVFFIVPLLRWVKKLLKMGRSEIFFFECFSIVRNLIFSCSCKKLNIFFHISLNCPSEKPRIKRKHFFWNRMINFVFESRNCMIVVVWFKILYHLLRGFSKTFKS